jgi:hypothetical protein
LLPLFITNALQRRIAGHRRSNHQTAPSKSGALISNYFEVRPPCSSAIGNKHGLKMAQRYKFCSASTADGIQL